MKLSVKAPPPVHGGLDCEEIRSLGLNPAEVLDFSSNLNPFFPYGDLLKNVCEGANVYPDAGYSELRASIASAHGVAPDSVFAGNGASEIVHLLCRCLPSSGSVLIPVPTFSEYGRAAAICGMRTVFCDMYGESCLRFNADKIASAVRREKPGLVFLCNPNNPTGLYLSRAEVEAVASAARGAVLVVDESYVDFVENPWDSTALAGDNVVILRSIAKFYGLAGIRMGYALSGPKVVSALNGVRPPWNVNSVAERAASLVFSLPLSSARGESRSLIFAARDFLTKRLEAAGKRCLPTDTGFFLVRAEEDAGSVRARLLKRGVAVRDCSSFGLPSHIRVSVRPEEDSEKLVKEWKETEGGNAKKSAGLRFAG